MPNKKIKKAFVSIFAVFFSAIVVSVLTAIYTLLIKQIEVMNVDSQSFQAMYAADSAFECAVLKEQLHPYTESVFLPANSGNLGNCGQTDDLVWETVPTSQAPSGLSIRAKSVANFTLTSQEGDFCAILNTDVETQDSSQWATPPVSNFMTIAGHNKACGTPNQKVVERVIDFYF